MFEGFQGNPNDAERRQPLGSCTSNVGENCRRNIQWEAISGLPLFFHFKIQEQFKNISRTLSKIQEHKKIWF